MTVRPAHPDPPYMGDDRWLHETALTEEETTFLIRSTQDRPGQRYVPLSFGPGNVHLLRVDDAYWAHQLIRERRSFMAKGKQQPKHFSGEVDTSELVVHGIHAKHAKGCRCWICGRQTFHSWGHIIYELPQP